MLSSPDNVSISCSSRVDPLTSPARSLPPPAGHTPALACAPNKDVADCLALILSTMKPFSQRDPSSCSSCSPPAVSPSPGLNLLKHCGITATCGPLPSNGLHNGYVKDRHGAPVGLDGCLSE